LRSYLRGWAKNINGLYKKERKEITNKLKELDKKAECIMLSPQELDVKHCLNVRLMQLLREEEIKWYQRSKSNKLLQGDSNSRYFHLVANDKQRKSHISNLRMGIGLSKVKSHLSHTLRTITKICLVLLTIHYSPLMKINEMT
jgi:hypothetical protein